jgi:hypothetical protein
MNESKKIEGTESEIDIVNSNLYEMKSVDKIYSTI